jgi:hypothetical protein
MSALVALATGSSALLLTACGESGVQVASSSPTSSQSAAPAPSSIEPMPTAEESSPSPAPVGAPFVDVVDQSLAPYSALIGSSASAADLGAALPLFDGDVPLPSSGIVGAGRLVERWGDALDATQQIGLDATPSKDELEAYGGAAPAGWAYNSISTTDSSSSLVMTRDSDGLRIVYVAFKDPEAGQPKAEFSLEGNASEIPQPAWLSSLPIPGGGELTSVGEGIGEVELNYIPAGSGLVTATWQFPSDQLQSLQEYYAGDALAEAGFDFIDPDAIRVGASYFDVVAGDWTGQVIVGELIDGEESFASVQWLLTRS